MAFTKRYRRKRGSKAKTRPSTTVTRTVRVRRRRRYALTAKGRMAMSVPRSLKPYPESKLVVHKYVDTFTTTAAAGAGLPMFYQFRANSTYDPDYTGVGHQPLYRDEMYTQYTNYTVLSATIKITIPPKENVAQVFALWHDTDYTIPLTKNTLQETRPTVGPLCLDRRNLPLVMKNSVNIAKVFNTNNRAYLADNLSRTNGNSNPDATRSVVWNFAGYPHDPTVTLAAQKFQVTIWQTCLWRDRVEPTGS